MANCVPFLFNQAFYDAGYPLNGGQFYTYQAGAGTQPFLTAYQDPLGATPFTNQIVLNAAGRPTNGSGSPLPIIWLQAGIPYKFVLYDSLNNLIWEQDNYLQVGIGFCNVAYNSLLSTTSTLPDGTALSDGILAFSRGSFAEGDGGSAWWYWNATDTDTADGATVIAAAGLLPVAG